MESMRNLNTSLPSSSVRTRYNQPSAELLQAFKAAALSVTQLYKTAASEDSSHPDEAHAAGYHEALEDIIDFLDQQNLGLDDGEGWQVRQWATQRLSSSSADNAASEASGRDPDGGGLHHDSDDDASARSSSPTIHHKTAAQQQQQQPSQGVSQQTTDRIAPREQQDQPETRQDVFHFRSPMSMPLADADNLNSNRQGNTRSSPPLVRLGVLPQRGNRHNGRVSSLGHGAGSKRKIVLPDFFDLAGINGFGDKWDGPGGNSGGGKRGRFA